MNITAARSEDLDSIVTLLGSADLPTSDLAPDRLSHFLIASESDQVVGVVGLEIRGRDALLRSLVVAAPHRGRRLGKTLVAAIEMLARQEGLGALTLLTTTAAAFFTRLGYRTIDRSSAPVGLQTTAEFARLCPTTATCMTRELS